MLPPSRRTASLVLLWISIMTTTVTMMKVTEDEYGFPITFECQNVALNETDTVTSITMEFFYDLAFARPDDMNELDQVTDLARAFVEGSLLQQLAAYYGFWDGQACEGQLEDLVWFIKLSSLEKDIPNPNLSSCYELQPEEDEECVSFQATMTGDIVGLDDYLDTVALIAQQMNANAVTATTDSLRVKFLGTELSYGNFTPGRDNLTPAKNVVQVSFQAPDDNTFTIVGIAIVAGMSLTVLALVFVIVRRRRRVKSSFQHEEFQDEVKSENDTGSETLRLEDGQSPPPGRDVDGEILNDDDNLPESPDEFSREYNFDLGGWMKSELLGIHGESAITAQPSYGTAVPPPPPSEEMLSDSDNDSWAQTEATIGSLELRLDPIEAEV